MFGSLQEIALLLEMNSLQLILIEKTVFPKGTLFSMDGERDYVLLDTIKFLGVLHMV